MSDELIHALADTHEQRALPNVEHPLLRVPPNTPLPPALKRLVEEVRNEQADSVPVHRYDRIHNRHNRS